MSPRNRSIACDAAFGVTFQTLADKHDTHVSRIGQIVTSELRSLGLTLEQARKTPQAVAYRYRYGVKEPRVWEPAQTPEQFYYEVNQEPRICIPIPL